MRRVFEDYLNRLQDLHQEVEKAVSGLSLEALDWKPTPDMNSLNVLVVHLAGAERYWIGAVAAQDNSIRDREAEFRTQGLDETALKRRLAEATAQARQALETLALQDLEAERISPRDGRKMTVAYALDHALAHTALHAGHAQMTRQLWDQRQPM